MTNFFSKAEEARFKKYKKHFTTQGFPADVAAQYSWDMIHVSRKQKANHGFDIKVVR